PPVPPPRRSGIRYARAPSASSSPARRPPAAQRPTAEAGDATEPDGWPCRVEDRPRDDRDGHGFACGYPPGCSIRGEPKPIHSDPGVAHTTHPGNPHPTAALSTLASRSSTHAPTAP